MEPQSCSASAFPYFEADAELGVIDERNVADKLREIQGVLKPGS